MIGWAIMRLSSMNLLSGLVSSLGCAGEEVLTYKLWRFIELDSIVMSTSRRIRVDESSNERLIGQVA